MSIKGTVCSGCVGKPCHNKVESHWRDRDGAIHTIEDCAPRRTVLMLQDTTNRLSGLQAAIEQLRDQIADLKAMRTTIDALNQQVNQLCSLAEFETVSIPLNHKEHSDDVRAIPHREL